MDDVEYSVSQLQSLFTQHLTLFGQTPPANGGESEARGVARSNTDSRAERQPGTSHQVYAQVRLEPYIFWKSPIYSENVRFVHRRKQAKSFQKRDTQISCPSQNRRGSAGGEGPHLRVAVVRCGGARD